MSKREEIVVGGLRIGEDQALELSKLNHALAYKRQKG